MRKVYLILIFLMLISAATPVYAQQDEISNWAVEYVNDVKRQNLFDVGIFKDPKSNITRGEFSYIGVRLYEKFTGKEATVGSATFNDTDYIWALKAKNIGLVSGYSDNTFKPNNPIRRDELAVLFVNLLKISNATYNNSDSKKFADDDKIISCAKEAVYIAKANNIIGDVENNLYNPEDNPTKEEVLVMVSRVVNSDSIKPNAKNRPIQIRMTNKSNGTLPEFVGENFNFDDYPASSRDLSNYDFRNCLDDLVNIVFHNNEKFPNKQYLPVGFDPEKILNWGREPVLNVDKLHDKGITGKDINVAYIDQSLKITHNSIKGKNIYYDYVDTDEEYDIYRSMHGISVANILLMTAPDANLYFIGHPAYFRDQTTHASAIYKILDINKTLSEKDKIKVIGFSDNPDNNENNKEAFLEAVEEANNQGVVVFFADNNRVEIEPYLDRSNPENYKTMSNWEDPNRVHFPTTYTLGNTDSDDHYTYWPSGGTSWTTPMQVGLSALAFQIDPNLDPFKINDYMIESAFNVNGVKIINPEGFINLVKKNKQDKQYYYNLVYNSQFVTSDDLEAIEQYSKSLADNETTVRLVDVRNINNAKDIYNELKKYHEGSNLILKGIQIFGTDNEVSAFRIHDKVDMGSYGIHDLGTILTDHFYSNFNNDPNIINENLNMKKVFEENIDIDFNPEWDMARLPLQKGEIAKYYTKYLDYKSQIENEKLPLVNFSNPIFAGNAHVDNFGYFIKERLDGEFGIISDDQYRLYGNLKGYYPINTDVLGGFTRENLTIENKRAINNYVINSHGQMDNIDSAYYTSEKKESEVRESLVNNNNVNEVLNYNYYNLFLWDCWGSANLSNSNITQLMLKEGKAVNIIGSTYITSNNGIDVYDTLEELKGNNGISLFYSTMKGIYYNNYSWSESFNHAKRNYIKYNLLDRSCEDGNYQFNMNNAIEFHYLGLLEKLDESNVIHESIQNPIFIENNDVNSLNIPVISKTQNEFVVFQDDKLKYENIEYRNVFETSDIVLNEVSCAIDSENVYVKIKYNSDIQSYMYIFLQGDTPGLSKLYQNATKIGDNIIIFKFNKEALKSYTAGLAINLGERNFVFIDKDLMDSIADMNISVE